MKFRDFKALSELPHAPPELPRPSVWVPCQCGGKYAFAGIDEPELPCVYHTTPFCARYEAITTCNDAVRFSEENRLARAN